MSTLKVNNIKDASGGTSNLKIDGAAKAWVNFNGTGTVAIRDDLNVSSITDNGTGKYTVNFTTAMSNANYAVAVAGSDESESDPPFFFGCACESFATSSFNMFTRRSSTITDMNPICAVVFGD